MLRILTCVISLLVLCSHSAFAAMDRTGKVDVGVNVSATGIEEDDFDTAAYFGGNVSYGITNWFAVGFEGGWAEYEPDVSAADLGLTTFSGGDISGVPLLFDFIFRATTLSDDLDVYAVVGLGGVLWDLEDISGTLAGIPISVDTDVDDTFAVKVGGGIDWFLTENWILNVDGGYVFAETDTTSTLTGGGVTVVVSQELDADYWAIGGGLKYLFS